MTPALAAFLDELLTVRRTQPVPPSDIGERVLASRFRSAFSLRTLERWLDQHDWTMWPCMPTSNAFEERIKRCGEPAHVEGVWDRGWWVPKHEAPPVENISPAQLEQLMLELAASHELPATPRDETVRPASSRLGPTGAALVDHVQVSGAGLIAVNAEAPASPALDLERPSAALGERDGGGGVVAVVPHATVPSGVGLDLQSVGTTGGEQTERRDEDGDVSHE